MCRFDLGQPWGCVRNRNHVHKLNVIKCVFSKRVVFECNIYQQTERCRTSHQWRHLYVNYDVHYMFPKPGVTILSDHLCAVTQFSLGTSCGCPSSLVVAPLFLYLNTFIKYGHFNHFSITRHQSYIQCSCYQ